MKPLRLLSAVAPKAPLLLTELGADGAFLGGRLVSIRRIRPHGPAPDPADRAFDLMRLLSLQDFPDTAPRFVEAGSRLLPPSGSARAARLP